jgi:hypothetical protein
LADTSQIFSASNRGWSLRLTVVSTLNLFETSNVTTGSREANFVWYALEQRRASESGGSPDKSGGGVEQNPSPVVSLALDATLSRKGEGRKGIAR